MMSSIYLLMQNSQSVMSEATGISTTSATGFMWDQTSLILGSAFGLLQVIFPYIIMTIIFFVVIRFLYDWYLYIWDK